MSDLPELTEVALFTLPAPLLDHPRLLDDEERFSALRGQVKTDASSARIFADLRQRADVMLAQPAVIFEKEGLRLLSVSREALARITTLAMVARLTDDPRYAARAITELRAVAAFDNWNPSHFLDTAEMTLAVAIGYDWLYERLEPADRSLIAGAILDKGLAPSEAGPSGQNWWINTGNNWNQVCHAGMVAGAVAVADEHPALAERIIRRAIENLHFSATSYGPDGAYPEGPMYWCYGTTFHVILVDALEHLTGKTYGLDAFPGFLASAGYMLHMLTPTGLLYSYADCDLRAGLGINIPQYWFARKTGSPGLLFGNNAAIATTKADEPLLSDPSRVEALALLWLNPALSSAIKPPLSWFGRGQSPVSTHRSGWSDARATFVGLKGGAANVSHGHMDVGSFMLEADGVRWAVDTGMQEYHSLESRGIKLWESAQDGQRWTIFRIGPEAHAILRFNGAAPKADARAELVRFSSNPASSVVNLDQIYADQVKEVSRGVMLLPDRRVLIQDEWTAGLTAVEATWQMLTQADEVMAGATEVRLRQAGESLILQVLSPDRIKIMIEDVGAPRAAHDAANPKLKRILISTPTAAGATGGFRILAIPGTVAARSFPNERPLSEWGDAVT